MADVLVPQRTNSKETKGATVLPQLRNNFRNEMLPREWCHSGIGVLGEFIGPPLFIFLQCRSRNGSRYVRYRLTDPPLLSVVILHGQNDFLLTINFIIVTSRFLRFLLRFWLRILLGGAFAPFGHP